MDLERGDYCIINGEIVRFTNDNINNILRGQFGTPASLSIENYDQEDQGSWHGITQTFDPSCIWSYV